MMFDDALMPVMNTGTSMKTNSTKESQEEFSEECMRVTTTEANDLFNEEIWNPSICTKNINFLEEKSEIRQKPEEEYFRLVSIITVPNSPSVTRILTPNLSLLCYELVLPST